MEYQTETWLPIPGYEDDYEASDQGRVRRVTGETLVGQRGDKDGYLRVSLAGRRLRVNRVICLTFHGPPPTGKPLALHENGVNTDNRAENLRWGSWSDNMNDAVKHGTQFSRYRGKGVCTNGHPFTEENTYMQSGKWRLCKTCRRETRRAYRARLKTQAAA